MVIMMIVEDTVNIVESNNAGYFNIKKKLINGIVDINAKKQFVVGRIVVGDEDQTIKTIFKLYIKKWGSITVQVPTNTFRYYRLVTGDYKKKIEANIRIKIDPEKRKIEEIVVYI